MSARDRPRLLSDEIAEIRRAYGLESVEALKARVDEIRQEYSSSSRMHKVQSPGSITIVIKGVQRPGEPALPRTVLTFYPKPLPNPAISRPERR